ncbi:MAG: hypothetical protein M1133_03985 [Armatimonadetes bacterium]|nr:hypothetical protein [Armatimonadota bacterium]
MRRGRDLGAGCAGLKLMAQAVLDQLKSISLTTLELRARSFANPWSRVRVRCRY